MVMLKAGSEGERVVLLAVLLFNVLRTAGRKRREEALYHSRVFSKTGCMSACERGS